VGALIKTEMPQAKIKANIPRKTTLPVSRVISLPFDIDCELCLQAHLPNSEFKDELQSSKSKLQISRSASFV
jgi:hypothetical protein